MASLSESLNGPDLAQYLETRFNLLSSLINKAEATINDRINLKEEALIKEILHIKLLFDQEQASNARAIDKAEAAQKAVNVASNEWRATLSDALDKADIAKAGLITRPEFELITKDLTALRQEVSNYVAARFAEQNASKGNKEDSNKGHTMLLSAIGVVVAVVALIFTLLRK